MKIFLTGGSGYIGQNFIKVALENKHSIFAVTRRKRKNKKNLKWLVGKLNRNWKELKSCDVLVHLASTGISNQNLSLAECIKTNVVIASELFFNAIRVGCVKWVIIGSSSEFGDSLKSKKRLSSEFVRKPNNNYGFSKYLISEIVFNLVKSYNLQCRYARLFQVYGKNEKSGRLLKSLNTTIKKNKKFIVKNPNEIRDFIHVDLVSKKLLEMTNFKEKYSFLEKWHVASGKPMKIKNFVLKNTNKSQHKNIKFSKKKLVKENHISDTKSIWT